MSTKASHFEILQNSTVFKSKGVLSHDIETNDRFQVQPTDLNKLKK